MTDGNSARARRLLLTHLGVCAGAVTGGWLWFRLGLRFPPCRVYQLTGLCCLTCGATRAVAELLRGHLLHSLLLNPVPILVGLFVGAVLVFELVQAFGRRDRRFRWGLHCVVAIVAVALIYCILRNFGFAPTPNDIYP